MECRHCGAVAPAGEDLCPDCGMSLRDEGSAKPAETKSSMTQAQNTGKGGLLVLTHGIALCVGILLGAWIVRTGFRDAGPEADRSGPPSAAGDMVTPSMPGHPPVKAGTKAPPMSEVLRIMEERGMNPEDMGVMGGVGESRSPHGSTPSDVTDDTQKEEAHGASSDS